MSKNLIDTKMSLWKQKADLAQCVYFDPQFHYKNAQIVVLFFSPFYFHQ